MRKLAALAMVFLGVLALVYAGVLLNSATFSLPGWSPDAGPIERLGLLLGLVPAFITALFGVYLILNRSELAARWFEDEEVSMQVDPEHLVRVGVLLIGFWMTLSSVNSIISTAAWTIGQAAYEPGFPNWQTWFELAGQIVRLSVGVFVIVRAAKVSEWLWTGKRPTHIENPTDHQCPECGHEYDPADYDPAGPARCTQCGERLQIHA